MTQELKPGKLYRYSLGRELWRDGPHRINNNDFPLILFEPDTIVLFLETSEIASNRKEGLYEADVLFIGHWHKVIIGDTVGWLYNEDPNGFTEASGPV